MPVLQLKLECCALGGCECYLSTEVPWGHSRRALRSTQPTLETRHSRVPAGNIHTGWTWERQHLSTAMNLFHPFLLHFRTSGNHPRHHSWWLRGVSQCLSLEDTLLLGMKYCSQLDSATGLCGKSWTSLEGRKSKHNELILQIRISQKSAVSLELFHAVPWHKNH